MKYKKGDNVKIKTWEDFAFTRNFMKKFSEKIVTIEAEVEGTYMGKYYLTDAGDFAIFDEEIESLANEYISPSDPIESRLEILDIREKYGYN